jgi:hypothetical protein
MWIVCGLLTPLPLLAADDGAAAAARRAQLAQEERDTARRIVDWDAQLATDYFRCGGFVKDDLVQSKKAAEADAAVHDRIAAAYEAGREDEVKRLRDEAKSTERVRLVWRDRIADYRKRQFDAAPSEQWFQEYSRWLGTETMPELSAWAEARKAASEAWGRVAEAAVPGADAGALVELKEHAYTADAEREMAEWRYNWARERAQMWPDRKVTSPELVKRLEELRAAQERRLAVRRAEIEQDRKAREAERAMKAAEAEFRKAQEAAQREAVERAKGKR